MLYEGNTDVQRNKTVSIFVINVFIYEVKAIALYCLIFFLSCLTYSICQYYLWLCTKKSYFAIIILFLFFKWITVYSVILQHYRSVFFSSFVFVCYVYFCFELRCSRYFMRLIYKLCDQHFCIPSTQAEWITCT